MTTEGLMDITPAQAFYVYIADMTVKPVYLPMLMIVASGSNAPPCIVHVPEDERYMLEESQHSTTPVAIRKQKKQ